MTETKLENTIKKIKDPQELYNVANKYPEVVHKIETIMRSEHTTAEIKKFRMKQLGDK